ncbi:ribosomal protein L34-domain-containing protein [Aspergillus filifer]
MLCLRCRVVPSVLRTATSSALPRQFYTASHLTRATQSRAFSLASTKFTITPTRPTLTSALATQPQTTQPSILSQLPQTRSFSASAALGAPRKTYNPSRRVQKRRHGFLARLRTKNGQQILKRRRAKGRKALSW